MRVCLVSLLFMASAPWQTGNRLAADYNVWATMRNARVSDPARVGTLDKHEVEAWKRVKGEWRELEREVDAEYGGR